MSTVLKSPTHIRCSFSSIPRVMRQRKQWVCWQKERRDGKEKKIPISARTGIHIDATKEQNWSSFAEAVAFYEEHQNVLDGIGYCLKDGDFTFIDLDECRDPRTTEIRPWAADIVRSFRTYTEISPSETGLHLFLEGPIPAGLKGNRKNVSKGKSEIKFEIYDRARFATFTGRRLSKLKDVELPDSPRVVDANIIRRVHREIFGDQNTKRRAKASSPPSGKRFSDDEILNGARNAADGDKFRRLFDDGDIRGYESPSEADLALCRILAFWTNCDAERIDQLFRRSALNRLEKWAERSDYSQGTISKAIKHVIETINPPATPMNAIEAEALALATVMQSPTEDNVALLFEQKHGDSMRFCSAWGKWMVWNGAHWRTETTGLAFDYCRRIARSVNLKHKSVLARSTFASGVERYIRAARRFATESNRWDRHVYLLNTPEQTIDMQPADDHETD